MFVKRARVFSVFTLVLFAFSLLTILFSPGLKGRTLASDEWKILNNLGGSSSNGAEGNAAMKKLADALTIKFNNAGSVHVELAIDELLFNDVGISNITWHDAYSGDYTWGKDPDDNWGFVYGPKSLGIKASNDDPLSVLGFIKTHGDFPGPNASQAEISNWANKLEVFFGVFRKTGHLAEDRYEYFVDVNDNGGANGDWWEYINDIGQDFATTDGDRGVPASNGLAAGRSSAANVAVRYIYQSGQITAIKADKQDEAAYIYSNSSTIKHYYKSNKDNLTIYNSDWDTKTKEQVEAYFNTQGNVTATLHDGTKTKEILVAGSNSSAAQSTVVTNAGEDAPSCETSGFTLSWIFCGVINGLASFTQYVFSEIIEPYLRESPVDTTSGTAANPNPIYQVWAAMRNIADVILLFALLAIVFGQAIGGGIVDAYTAKKALPRILVAAVLINLSLFIVAALVDLFNVLGGAIGDLIIGPFRKTILAKFQTSGATNTVGALAGAGGLLAATIGGLITVSVFKSFSKGKAATGSLSGGLGRHGLMSNGFLHFFLLFVLLPAVLISLAIFSTLVIRKGLITILIVVAPIAFAMFALPQTDKYFKKWWKVLVQTLLVYPIMTVIFSIATVLAAISYNANDVSNNAPFSGIVAAIVALVIAIIPLVLVPFAFKIAGGLIGNLYATVTSQGKRFGEAVKGNANDPNSLRNRVKHNAKNTSLSTRGDMISRLRSYSTKDKTGLVGRRMASFGMRALNYGDVDKGRKDQNELFDKEISGKVANGADFLERAFFARRWDGPDQNVYALDAEGGYVLDAAGNRQVIQTLRTGHYYSTYRGTDGKYGEHAEGDVKGAHARYDGNESKIQTLMKYELGKVSNDRDMYGVDSDGEILYDASRIGEYDAEKLPMGSYLANLPQVLQGSRLSLNSAKGATTGAHFATQQARRELKHTGIDVDPTTGRWIWKQKEASFVQDFAENVGSYQAATGKTSPIKNLTRLYKKTQKLRAEAARSGKPFTPEMAAMELDLKKIAFSLDTRMRRGDFGPVKVDGADVTPGAPGGNVSGGAGRVNAAIQEFLTTVGTVDPSEILPKT